MVEKIESDIQTILKSQLKRKKEDERLAQFNKQLTQHNLTIQELHSSIEKKKLTVEERKQQLESHQVYTNFLQDVVADKALGDNQNIEWLRGRFINLKNENKKLKNRKASINQDMEDIKEQERQTLGKMTAQLYEKQKKMQKLQKEIEKIGEQNQNLEQDFENEISKKNQNSMEAG